MFKKILAGFLTLGIIFSSFMYTYSEHNIPFRQRAFVIQNANGEELYLTDMCKTWVKYSNTLTDINAEWRQEDITVTGTIEVDKTIEENNNYKVFSKDNYCQAGRDRFFKTCYIDNGLSTCSRTVVIYFKNTNQEIKKLISGDKLSFKANFNKLSATCLVLTEGEIV